MHIFDDKDITDKEYLLKLILNIEQNKPITFQDRNILSKLARKHIKKADYFTLACRLELSVDHIAQLAR